MMKTTTLVARLLLGAVLLVFGLNKFLLFLPAPELPPAASNFFGALIQSGYIMPMVAVTEITVGVMLLSGLFVPLALVLLAPLSVNIILFHLSLAPALDAMAPAILVAALNLFLLFRHKGSYGMLLKPR